MPTFSAFISTLLLLGMALMLQNKLSIWSVLPRYDQFWTIFAAIVAVTVAWSGWLYVATRRVAAGRVHGLIMAAIGCFGLYHGIGILADRSIAGGRGPDANSMAGVVYGIGLLAGAIGAVALIWLRNCQ